MKELSETLSRISSFENNTELSKKFLLKPWQQVYLWWVSEQVDTKLRHQHKSCQQQFIIQVPKRLIQYKVAGHEVLLCPPKSKNVTPTPPPPGQYIFDPFISMKNWC